MTRSLDRQIKLAFTVKLSDGEHRFTQDALAVRYDSQNPARPAIDLLRLNNNDTRAAADLLRAIGNPPTEPPGGGRTKRRRPRRKRKSRRKLFNRKKTF